MPIPKERELPKVNSEYKKTLNGKTYTLRVVKAGSGVAYELNGKIFNTPTAAAKSLTKNEINGWKFWKMDR